MQQREELDDGQDFGALLKILRVPRRIKQATVVALLADKGWTATSYTRLENGDVAPSFDQLLPIYRALFLAGVSFSLADRHQFVERARKKIDSKKTHRDVRTDGEWAQLRYELARLDGLSESPTGLPERIHVPHKLLLADTDHLIGRESWREDVLTALGSTPRTKLLVIHGPAGVGKSSELNWLATYFFCRAPTTHRVILCDLRSLERTSCPEDALCILMGTILTELGATESQTPMLSLDEQMRVVLAHLEKQRQPCVVFIDHAECLLQEHGLFAPCWEHLFSQVLRGQHRVTLVLATKQWPGWYGGERCFVAEHPLPPLPVDQGILLLQQQGLDSVPIALLEHVHDKVGGIPLALEWVATLVKVPLQVEDWEAFATSGQAGAQTQGKSMTQAVERLLAEPHIFGGSLADAVAPLLQRILVTQHLSEEASCLLQVLAVATIALAKPALQVLCPQGPYPIKELRRASLLVAYPDRVQLLPMVAAGMYRHLTAEQRLEQETILIQAYSAWLQDGTFHEGDNEQGAVITELAVLLLKQHRLLEAAQLVICYDWLSFRLGHGPRLALLAQKVMQEFDWHVTLENECGGLLLYYRLVWFLDTPVDEKKRCADYHYIHSLIIDGKVEVPPTIEITATTHLMMHAIGELRFEEAQTLLDVCCERLEARPTIHLDLRASLLEKRARLLGRWSEYAQEQQDIPMAQGLQAQAIAICRQIITLLSDCKEQSPLETGFLKKRLARAFNNLGYYLNRIGQYEEALRAIEQSITLKEQGYVEFDTLADAYGEKSQILASLGRFQEALLFDEKAVAEVERLARIGFSYAQEELPMYLVNRGYLYLRLGRVAEAEHLLREASPHIHPRRRTYRMFAKETLEEINQWRQHAASSRHQLDWRWVERYREIDAYDAYWWWSQAGPFTQEEQQQWARLYAPNVDEATKEQLGKLIVQSRQRELMAAITEQRQPRLHYPALDIQAIRDHIAGLLTLDEQIHQQEPNAIVRRLYHGAIEDEFCFLRLIEATHEGDTDRFWELTRRLFPEPTVEEMNYALAAVRRVLQQGLLLPVTADLSRRVHQIMAERLHLELDLSCSEEERQALQGALVVSSAQSQHKVTPQTAKRFFESILRESGYEGWQVIIDPKEGAARVESALRLLFVPDEPISLEDLKHLLAHELAGHVARSFAGDHSPLGLLGMNSKSYEFAEEGIALYHERQVTTLHGEVFDDFGVWIGTLAIGLACGVLTPPQTFMSLLPFFESLSLLMRLLDQPDQDVHIVQEQARKSALTRSLRLFRGVPDLERVGICATKDVVYLRGLQMVERAVAEDETLLDRLAVGKISLQQLSDLEELGMSVPPQPLRELAYAPNLDAYILSFEKEEHTI